jgi:hypothetical protein
MRDSIKARNEKVLIYPNVLNSAESGAAIKAEQICRILFSNKNKHVRQGIVVRSRACVCIEIEALVQHLRAVAQVGSDYEEHRGKFQCSSRLPPFILLSCVLLSRRRGRFVSAAHSITHAALPPSHTMPHARSARGRRTGAHVIMNFLQRHLSVRQRRL